MLKLWFRTTSISTAVSSIAWPSSGDKGNPAGRLATLGSGVEPERAEDDYTKVEIHMALNVSRDPPRASALGSGIRAALRKRFLRSTPARDAQRR